MEISYLGHSCFLLRHKKVRVVCDPYDRKVGFSLAKLEAEIVTVSYDHHDHNNLEAIEGEPMVIKGPGEYEIEEVGITGLATYHDDKEGKLRGKNTIYIFDIDEIRIVHLGDLGHKLSDKDLDIMDGVDVLMVPVGGGYTLDPGQAMEVVKQIGPSIVIPMHYRTKEHDQKAFSKVATVDDFVKESGMEERKETKLVVKKLDLPEETELVVLQKKH